MGEPLQPIDPEDIPPGVLPPMPGGDPGANPYAAPDAVDMTVPHPDQPDDAQLAAADPSYTPPSTSHVVPGSAADWTRNSVGQAGAGGAAGDYYHARMTGAPPDVVAAKRAEAVAERDTAVQFAKEHGYKSPEAMRRDPDWELKPSADPGATALMPKLGEFMAASTAARGTTAGAAPAAGGYGGGYYAPPAPQTPVELRAGVELADVKTPGEYSNELRALIASGEISPEEGRKRATEYRDWYGSVQGGATRLEGSGIAQQDRAQQVALEQQDADIQAAQRVADLKAQAAQAAQDLAEQQKAAADAHAAAMRDAQGNLATAMQRSEEYKIDPSRTFSSGAGVAAGVLAGLGTMLGAIGQGMSNGRVPNAVPPMIERMIDREVDKQKAEQANLSRGVANRQNLMQLAKSHFDDDEQQRAVVKAAMYSTLAAQADQIASEATTDRAKRAAMLGAEQLRAKVADQQLAFETRTKAQAQLAAQQAAQQAAAYQAASAQSRAQTDADRVHAAGGTVAYEADKDTVNRWNEVLGGYVTNEGMAKEVTTKVVGLNGIVNGLQEMLGFANKKGVLSPDDRAKLQSLAMNLAPDMSTMGGQGAMSKDEVELIGKRIATGDFDPLGTDAARVKTTMGYYKQKAEAIAQSAGVIPGDRPFVTGGKWYAPMRENLAAVPIEEGTGKNKRTGMAVMPDTRAVAPATKILNITDAPPKKQI